MKYLFLRPHLESQVWGGMKLNALFSSGKKISEAWIVSGIQYKSSVIQNKKYKGMFLNDFYNNYRGFFDNHLHDEYPLLAKILDCNENLSVQVHPNDAYAKKHNVQVKNEAWYFIDCDRDYEIVYGHKAKTINGLEKMIKEQRWGSLLKFKKVFPGSVINVPTGTIHGLKKGCLVFEIQQPSTVTYRLYDYDRHLPNRPLHINECVNSTNIPFVDTNINTSSKHLDTQYFSLHVIENKHIKRYSFDEAKWIQIYVFDGYGKIDFNKLIKKGDTLIINSNNKSFWLRGQLKIIVTYIKK